MTSSFQRWDPEGGVPRHPFRLDPDGIDRPSTFVAEMITDEVRYTYGFVVNSDRVAEEWLYSYPLKKKRVLFERTDDTIMFGSTMPELKTKLEVVGGLTRPNPLFLSVAAQSNIDLVLPAYREFREGLIFR